ncbi:MAG: riboflavin biosynthesis protein RibF [Patescibacteria group bacterium]
MYISRSLDEAALHLAGRGTVLTIGTFDGVHLGHQRIVEELQAQAKARDLLSLVITFARHPAGVIAGEAPPLLMPLEDRLDRLAGLGVDACLLLEFDADLADSEPAGFARDVLGRGLGARAVVIGHDFRFGARGKGDGETLAAVGRESGFEVIRVAPVVVGGTVVSSTAIRWMLAAGDVARARAYLGRAYSIKGIVQTGAQRGRRLGYPTANLAFAPGVLWPRFGVYLVRIALGAETRFGLANVGVKPTFGRHEPAVEVHLFSYQGDLYATPIEAAFLSFLRPERRFATPRELRAQIETDIAEARAMLERGVPETASP